MGSKQTACDVRKGVGCTLFGPDLVGGQQCDWARLGEQVLICAVVPRCGVNVTCRQVSSAAFSCAADLHLVRLMG